MRDGSVDYSGGVNSVKVTTVISEQNPNGLARNELAWLVNATVRDGGITQRTGWQPICTIASTGLYQGGVMYVPTSDSFPYLVLNVSGATLKVDPTTGAVTNLTGPLTGMPASQPYFFYCQGEEFLVIQAGDGSTLPLFWDNTNLRRSIGITTTAVAPGTPGINEIPAATAMDYYQGRLWYAQGRSYSAGDIVFGASGTVAYNFRNAILNVTENPLVVGGDGFAVPTNAGNIRSIFHTANLNQQLGQGPLFIGTRQAIYSLTVPVTRNDWIAATNNNQPNQTVAQLFYGPVNDRSIVKINSDAYFQTLEPAIRSHMMSVRYFDQWANIAISSNIDRVLSFDDRSLLKFGSGMLFENRVWQTQLPRQTPYGVVHDAVAVLDFTPMSTFGAGHEPVWEGIYQGLQVFQFFSADFGGRERAFAVILGANNTIQLWEMTDSNRFENGDNRVTWVIEFPAYTWGQEFMLKKLISGELWVDKLYGTVVFKMEYRPDGETCWLPWHEWKACSARNSAEDCANPVTYPLENYREGYRQTMVLPEPKAQCSQSTGRPSNVLYQCQCRLTVHGWCRLRGLYLDAIPTDKSQYRGMVC